MKNSTKIAIRFPIADLDFQEARYALDRVIEEESVNFVCYESGQLYKVYSLLKAISACQMASNTLSMSRSSSSSLALLA